MITLHDKDELDFSRNGYGKIDKYVDSDDDKGKWEMNGEYSLDFSVSIHNPFVEHFKEENIIQSPVPFTSRQLFRIHKVDIGLTKIRISARHIFYDLLNNWIEDTFVVEKDGHAAINQILDRILHPHKFNGVSNINTLASARIVDMNPVAAILNDQASNTFVSRWGGEIDRDNFNIGMYNQLGVDRGITIRHKKNLTGYSYSIDYSNIVTQLLPVGFDGLKLPERYIISEAADIYGLRVNEFRYGDIKAAIGEYADDEDAIPLDDAYDELRRIANEEFTKNNIDEPKTVVKVDFVALHNTKEYEDLAILQQVQKGDVVRVVSDEIEEMNVTSRLVAFEFSMLQENHYYSTTLGNHTSDFTSSGPVSNTIIREEIEEVRKQSAAAIRSANRSGQNYYVDLGDPWPTLTTHALRVGDRLYEDVGSGETKYYVWSDMGEWQIERVSAGLVSGTLDAMNGDIDIINMNANNISAGELDLAKGLRIGNDINPVMYINEDGEVVLNVQSLLINSFDPESDSVHVDDLNDYVRYQNGIVEIGERNAEVKTQFGNDEWAMIRNDQRQMWLEEDIINIRKAHFFERIQIGNYGFVPRQNGSLDLRKVVD